MLNVRRDACLVEEHFLKAGVVDELGPDRLDGEELFEAPLAAQARQPHRGHAAGGNPAKKFVTIEPVSGSKGARSGLHALVYSSSVARSLARTPKSSSVVVSPLASVPAAISLSNRRMILPLRVFGSASVNRSASGLANLPTSFSVGSVTERLSSLLAFWPALSVTKTTRACPLSSSGRPTAAASATDVLLTTALSISAVPMRCPATLSTSSMRPTTQKYPSPSRRAPSPVKYALAITSQYGLK